MFIVTQLLLNTLLKSQHYKQIKFTNNCEHTVDIVFFFFFKSMVEQQAKIIPSYQTTMSVNLKKYVSNALEIVNIYFSKTMLFYIVPVRIIIILENRQYCTCRPIIVTSFKTVFLKPTRDIHRRFKNFPITGDYIYIYMYTVTVVFHFNWTTMSLLFYSNYYVS